MFIALLGYLESSSNSDVSGLDRVKAAVEGELSVTASPIQGLM